VIADGDNVDLTNLQRQIIHRESAIGENKAVSAKAFACGLNSTIEVVAIPTRLAGDALDAAIAGVDLVLDCSDNFATRHAVNRGCVKHAKKLVSGAAIRFDGQLVAFDVAAGSPCYACLFADAFGDTNVTEGMSDAPEERCGVMGVFAPLVGMVGTAQAAEAIRLLCGVGEASTGRLRLLNGLDGRWREVRFARDRACSVCGTATLIHAHHTQTEREVRHA
jgi:molybdopterin-synthase adenylyltransferase